MGDRVKCDSETVMLENEDGREQPGIRLTCQRCGHTTESFGTSEKSTKRCLVLMREECPEGEENYYVEDA